MTSSRTAISVRPAYALSLPALADLFNRGFEGYFFSFEETAESLALRLSHDSIDLGRSRVVLIGQSPVGLLYLAVRGRNCRVAGMGVVREARRAGFGRLLMETVIRESRASGLREMVLEVIEQNEPALELYRRFGFEVVRRLVGYEWPGGGESRAQGVGGSQPLEEVDPRHVARRIAAQAPADLPWQLAPETFLGQGTRLRGWSLEERAFALTHDPGEGAMVLEALLVPGAHRRTGQASRLWRQLVAGHAGRSWRVPARVPEGLADGFLEAQGFHRSELTQLEMRLPLAGG